MRSWSIWRLNPFNDRKQWLGPGGYGPESIRYKYYTRADARKAVKHYQLESATVLHIRENK